MTTRKEDAHLDIAAASHPGKAGKKNEDRYRVSSFLTGPERDIPAVLAVLCDGIGGHRAGEVAAQMGVDLITEVVLASDGEKPLKTLEKAIRHANHAIFEASLSDRGRKGMGATCACAWVIDDRLYTANLGDSRIYLLRGDHILQLSTDHTWLQEAFDAGIIDDPEAEDHPNAHVIRRYLGSSKAPRPDFRLWFFEGEGDAEALENQGLRLEPGDMLLLCSDGLTDLVSDEEIHSLIKSTPLSKVPSALSVLANDRGGHDNITVIVIGVPTGSAEEGRKARRPRRLVGCLVGLLIFVLLAAALLIGLRWREGQVVSPTASPPAAARTVTSQPPGVFPVTATFTLSATVTLSPEVEEGMATPFPTLTPWPTHTSAP